ncbi:MAG: response regulator, partial [Spirochaetia bacterium]|nr:response regulator [Spirochaetia bacterium]
MGSSAKKILVVEDDPIVGHDIRFRLLRLGYDVVGLARTGPEAVSMVDERNPALVLMDIHLPDDDGDGVSSARRIRAATDIPIIFTTGLADEHTLARARLVEPAAFLMKPLEIREIQIAIETSLARLRDERNACTERTRFHAVLQSIDDGVIAADLEGRVRFMNAAAARLTGWGEKDAVGR